MGRLLVARRSFGAPGIAPSDLTRKVAQAPACGTKVRQQRGRSEVRLFVSLPLWYQIVEPGGTSPIFEEAIFQP